MTPFSVVEKVLKSVSEFINKTPECVSLLYDLDLMPEQCTNNRELSDMITIVDHFKQFEERLKNEVRQ